MSKIEKLLEVRTNKKKQECKKVVLNLEALRLLDKDKNLHLKDLNKLLKVLSKMSNVKNIVMDKDEVIFNLKDKNPVLRHWISSEVISSKLNQTR